MGPPGASPTIRWGMCGGTEHPKRRCELQARELAEKYPTLEEARAGASGVGSR